MLSHLLAVWDQVDTWGNLLNLLINDLHWFYNQRNLKRSYATTAIRKVSRAFIVAFLLFLLTLVFASAVATPVPADAQRPQLEEGE